MRSEPLTNSSPAFTDRFSTATLSLRRSTTATSSKALCAIGGALGLWCGSGGVGGNCGVHVGRVCRRYGWIFHDSAFFSDQFAVMRFTGMTHDTLGLLQKNAVNL